MYSFKLQILIVSLFCALGASAMTGDIFIVDNIVYQKLSSTNGVNCVGVTYDKNKFNQDPITHKFIGTTYSGEITVPSSVICNGVTYQVTEICVNAFHGSQELISVTLPESIKVIGIESFRNCPQLKSINFPEGLEYIYFDAFTYDTALTEIVLPSSLKLIDAYAFCECRGLKSVILKDSDIPLEKPTYFGCSSIFNQIDVDYAYIGRNGTGEPVKIDTKELVLGDAITSLSEADFNPNTLEKITIPPSLKTIRKGTFKNAMALKDITILDGEEPIYIQRTVTSDSNGASTTYHYEYPFQNTPLVHAYIGRNFNPDYNSGYTTDYDAIGSAFSYAKKLKTVEFGPYVSRLFSYSFLRCENLESVDFSNAPITQIDEGCFSDCSELAVAILPETLKSIKTRAFDSCFKLGQVYLPQGLTEIGEIAFTSCGIEYLTIPGSVKTIEQGAFGYNRHLKYLMLEDGIETISTRAFTSCTSLTELSIPGSVTLLKEDAFSELTSLTSLRFEKGETDLNCQYNDSFGSDFGKKCLPVFTNSTQSLKEIYIDRDFSYDHFSGNTQYVHDYMEIFGQSWLTDLSESTPIVEYGPDVFNTATGMFKRFTALNKVVCQGTIQIPYLYDTFYKNSNINLYVPRGYAEKYTDYYFWRGFASVRPLSSLVLSDTEIILHVGDTWYLSVYVIPDDGFFTQFIWDSSDESVVTVENGFLHAIGEGTAVITVYAQDDPDLAAECRVDVTDLVGVNNVSEETLYVTTEALTAVIHGADPDSVISLHDLKGNLLYQGNNSRIHVPQSGIYILKVNNNTFRLRL